MIYFPGTINTVSTRLYYPTYIHQQWIHSSSAGSARHLLCACWHSEAVKGSSSLSSTRLFILTMGHVFSLPLSGANWRSLSLPWGLGPPSPKMALPFTGSAHTPFPGYKTSPIHWKCSQINLIWWYGFFKLGHILKNFTKIKMTGRLNVCGQNVVGRK